MDSTLIIRTVIYFFVRRHEKAKQNWIEICNYVNTFHLFLFIVYFNKVLQF